MADIHLRIVTPDRTIVDRKVASVSFVGTDGQYGVLPRHAPLMTGIAQSGTATIVETDGKSDEMFISDGFAQVQNNVLTLVCEAGELAGEIDLDRVKQKEQEARDKMAGLDKLSEEFLKAEASLRKALARERLARKRSGSGSL
ncbi:MAG: ATP synthase F1 subunit epsilon [Planctomycetota bacterium]|jgi:F-type H+-transporting ATPase subunit epsilon|nr:ATP synthase F1 subunit epsilon [Planctomycetota bacterium]MEC9048165.1 ATP synthase F1 subunit epsilon [Planctomycetota bacterium]